MAGYNGQSQGQRFVPLSPQPQLQLAFLDFDLTLTAVHVWNALSGTGDSSFSIPAPHAGTEKGQLSRIQELTKASGRGFVLQLFGGEERIRQLRGLLEELVKSGVKLFVITRGLVGTARKLLHEIGLQRYFLKVFGTVNGTSVSDYDAKLPPTAPGDDRRFQGDVSMDFQGSKPLTIRRCLAEYGVVGDAAVFVDDDPEEVKGAASCCRTLQVLGGRGLQAREMQALRAMLDAPRRSLPTGYNAATPTNSVPSTPSNGEPRVRAMTQGSVRPAADASPFLLQDDAPPAKPRISQVLRTHVPTAGLREEGGKQHPSGTGLQEATDSPNGSPSRRGSRLRLADAQAKMTPATLSQSSASPMSSDASPPLLQQAPPPENSKLQAENSLTTATRTNGTPAAQPMQNVASKKQLPAEGGQPQAEPQTSSRLQQPSLQKPAASASPLRRVQKQLLKVSTQNGTQDGQTQAATPLMSPRCSPRTSRPIEATPSRGSLVTLGSTPTSAAVRLQPRSSSTNASVSALPVPTVQQERPTPKLGAIQPRDFMQAPVPLLRSDNPPSSLVHSLGADKVAPSRARRKAVVIGCSYDTAASQFVPPLLGALHDSWSMLSVLRHTMGYKEDQVRHLFEGSKALLGAEQQQPTQRVILDSLQWLIAEARPGDDLTFYFAGYGTQDALGASGVHEPFLVPCDFFNGRTDVGGRTKFSVARLVPLRQIVEALRRLPADCVVTLIFDCAFHAPQLGATQLPSSVRQRYMDSSKQQVPDLSNGHGQSKESPLKAFLSRGGPLQDLQAVVRCFPAAFNPEQLCAEAPLEGTLQGIFTWAWVKAFMMCPSPPSCTSAFGDLILKALNCAEGLHDWLVWDSPGLYQVGHGGTMAVQSLAAPGSPQVDKLQSDQIVSVKEVREVADRIRGRIEKPDGWVSLKNTETGYRPLMRQLPMVQLSVGAETCEWRLETAGLAGTENAPSQPSWPGRIGGNPKRRKALLVGTNYRGQPFELKGCVNDVQQLRRTLRDALDYSEEQMQILTDADSEGPRRPLAPEKMPTKANILSHLDWLVEGAQAGDNLLFAFSGYGLQKPLTPDAEAACEACLVPVDVAQHVPLSEDGHSIEGGALKPGAQYNLVSLDMISQRLSRLPRGVHVTLVMDCAHAGIPGLRGSPQAVFRAVTRSRVNYSKMRHWVTRPRFLVLPTLPVVPQEGPRQPLAPIQCSVHCLGACRFEEYPLEMPLEGSCQGIFTWCFLRALLQHRLQGSVGEHLANVNASISHVAQTFKGVRQTAELLVSPSTSPLANTLGLR
eukprot:TRINITY_DN41704_c1_g1_i4.p1 TRINITY_DN41704_c1_g1~~TRINITY_DN41704_c1_g1_i4.p1  ORF type:complete len:1322 (-),score=252.27 TRINITY_DN41704_c1_g1_i4:208-4071(-)